jgi:hypothetical protein
MAAYRCHPTKRRKTAARGSIVSSHALTGFVTLDRLLMRLNAKKPALLMVLDRPEIPLHTNGSENDIRCHVTRRAARAVMSVVTVETPSSVWSRPVPSLKSPFETILAPDCPCPAHGVFLRASRCSSHIVLSIFKIEEENRSGSFAAEQTCEKWTLKKRCPDRVENLKIPCSSKDNSLFARINSLFRCAGNFIVTR